MYAEREMGGFAGGRIIEGKAGWVGNSETAVAEARHDWNPREIQQPLAALVRLAKIGPAPLTSERSLAKSALWPVPTATGESAADWSSQSAVIIDFAQARRSRQAAGVGEVPSNENQDGLTLKDWAVISYALVATAFYPVLAWFLISF